MKFTICDEDKVFPYLMIDDFYSKKEQKLIWKELISHKNNFKEDQRPVGQGVARDKDGKPISNSKRLYLDEMYGDNRQDSNILNFYTKIISPEVKEAYRYTTPSWRSVSYTHLRAHET